MGAPASEEGGKSPQSPGAANDSADGKEWPEDLQISVEYCIRSPFHARYDPEKYKEYFEMVRDVFSSRNPQMKIVGNPEGQKKPTKSFDTFGTSIIQESTDMPRLGAFEVTVNSSEKGLGAVIFSKLETRRWPDPRILVKQVERLLANKPMLQPLVPPIDPETGVRSPRKPARPPALAQRDKIQMASGIMPPPSPSAASSARSQPPAETTSPRPKSTPTAPSAPKPKKSGRRDPPVLQEASCPTSASPAKPKSPPKKPGSAGSPKPGSAKAQAAHAKATPTTPASAKSAADASPATDIHESFEDYDAFEGEESAEGSSGCQKVWMPGAAKEEKWESEDERPDTAQSNAQRSSAETKTS